MKSNAPARGRPRASEILGDALKTGLRKAPTPPPAEPGPRPTERARSVAVECLFPIVPFVPDVACAHRGKFREGVRLYCPVCHRSGVDHYAILRRDPRTDPRPDPRPAPPKPKRLTRKELRDLRRDYRLRADSLTPQERAYLKQLGVRL